MIMTDLECSIEWHRISFAKPGELIYKASNIQMQLSDYVFIVHTVLLSPTYWYRLNLTFYWSRDYRYQKVGDGEYWWCHAYSGTQPWTEFCNCSACGLLFHYLPARSPPRLSEWSRFQIQHGIITHFPKCLLIYNECCLQCNWWYEVDAQSSGSRSFNVSLLTQGAEWQGKESESWLGPSRCPRDVKTLVILSYPQATSFVLPKKE